MGTSHEHTAVAEWLMKPDVYPHAVRCVNQVETHISRVFLAGDYVYKLKKPVRFDFLDFSTLAAREHACREEVRLNRRLAADTYLDVAPIVLGRAGDLQLGGGGEIVDWLVAMRRLPTELTLDALHRRSELRPTHIDRLIATLDPFYKSLTPVPLTPGEYRARYLAHVRGNLHELLAAGHHLPRAVVRRTCSFQLQLLQLWPEIFDERVRSGRVVEGHGDLRPEHICLDDRVTIFDCIEFNPEFRILDVADELAFLAAECDFLGADWVGPQLLTAYRRESGDVPPDILWAFYKAYRACVRAKVAALRADQLDGAAQAAAAEDAQRHLAFADRYVKDWLQPLVLAVGGLAGTGKTTLASAVAQAVGGEVLRTDVLRQELFGAGSHAAGLDAGIYSRDARERVYAELFRQAAEWHARRVSVVLDGTFSTLDLLSQARATASDTKGLFLAVECVCRPEVAQARIRARLAEGRDESEARPEVHQLQLARWENWPSEVPQVRVDTEQTLERQVEQVLAALRTRMQR
jgi:aminoglycoside phosphotransferase family enzyme/predicted kinase